MYLSGNCFCLCLSFKSEQLGCEVAARLSVSDICGPRFIDFSLGGKRDKQLVSLMTAKGAIASRQSSDDSSRQKEMVAKFSICFQSNSAALKGRSGSETPLLVVVVVVLLLRLFLNDVSRLSALYITAKH